MTSENLMQKPPSSLDPGASIHRSDPLFDPPKRINNNKKPLDFPETGDVPTSPISRKSELKPGEIGRSEDLRFQRSFLGVRRNQGIHFFPRP